MIDMPANQTPIAKAGLFTSMARKTVLRRLAALDAGDITLSESDWNWSTDRSAELRAAIHVRHPRFYRRCLAGTLSIAESYLQGDWDCDDLTSLFRIVVRSGESAGRFDRTLAKLANAGHRLAHCLRANTRAGSRRNVREHYDLGNDFFGLWLDDTMAYSCGIFRTPASSLQDASLEKFDRVCRKLDLRPHDHLVEIGSGWGGLAIHAAGQYGCRVTTTTISREQFDLASRRIAESGLGKQITLLADDYRDLSGQYDKLASIEMIEAVGHQNFVEFFRCCGRLLRPGGTAVLQAIVMPESRYAEYLRSVDFIQRYVFPGGCLPSVAAMLHAAGQASDLRLVHLEDFAAHYGETLRRWRQAFARQATAVRRLGYSDRLIRMWSYYLSYCEAAFEERQIGLAQLVFDKPGCRRDAAELSARTAELRSHDAASLRNVTAEHAFARSTP